MAHYRHLIIAFFLLTKATSGNSQAVDHPATRYNVSNGGITGHNLGLYNNRPLYCNNTDAFVLTGDKPLVRMVQTPFVYGAFQLALDRNGVRKWLADFSDVSTAFSANKMIWTANDTSLGRVVVTLEVVPLKGEVGMAIHAAAGNGMPGDKLVWVYGGLEQRGEGSLSWALDIFGNEKIGQWSFDPAACDSNVAKLKDGQFIISPTKKVASGYAKRFVRGACSDVQNIFLVDTSFLSTGNTPSSDGSINLPLVCGEINLDTASIDVFWAIKPTTDTTLVEEQLSSALAWQEGEKFASELAHRIELKTPDPYLNALSGVSTAAINAVWYDPVFVHGGMLWNIPFPGWRTLYGGTVYGWHDRVKKEAEYYTSFQIKTSNKRVPKADTALMLTAQDTASVFFGKGRVNKDQFFYNFQSQFFDQLITEWRSTGDTGLLKTLWPSLTLHLQWQQRCFDADGDGVYESYLNGWPTDSQWYNGGGTAEETAYALHGHRAARDMARLYHDEAAISYHNSMMVKIRNGFFKQLWIPKKGHSGAYREQGGYRRLHEDPWLYSIFLPIDAGLLSNAQAAASLHYTETELQNDIVKSGGRRVWTSNWVPGIFSVRELYAGDNYHLALAYFLAGLADDAWDIMKGNFMQEGFDRVVPGNTGAPNGGTDFNDCSSMFARVLIEGLFGYRPNYPLGTVTLAPQFPHQWDNASIRTPDFAFRWLTSGDTIATAFSLSKPAAITLRVPFLASDVTKVLVDGQPVAFQRLAGFGHSIVEISLPKRKVASVLIITGKRLAFEKREMVYKSVGERFSFRFPDARIIEIKDEQNALSEIVYSGENLSGRTNNNPGSHTVLVKLLVNKCPQWRLLHFRINGVARQEDEMFPNWPPANSAWQCINMKSQFNADVRTIFQQQYLSPRPNTVSARIGTDGYSPWTFLYWKSKPPVIQLDSTAQMMSDTAHLLTKQNVPFLWRGEKENVAFTSLWDNWPSSVTVSVKIKGQRIWFMVCGSTNPMQCHIANAVIYLNYANGVRDSIELVPPLNYWTLAAYQTVPGAAGQTSRNDYTDLVDSFAVPKPWPDTLQLGQNCRAILLHKKMKKDKVLQSVTLKALSQEVVVGLMGITILKHKKGEKE